MIFDMTRCRESTNNRVVLGRENIGNVIHREIFLNVWQDIDAADPRIASNNDIERSSVTVKRRSKAEDEGRKQKVEAGPNASHRMILTNMIPTRDIVVEVKKAR